MQGSLLQAHRADKMRLDADAPARTEQRQLKMWAEIWEQAEGSQLGGEVRAPSPDRDVTSAFTLSEGWKQSQDFSWCPSAL